MDQDLITLKHRAVPVLLRSQFAFLTDQTRSAQYICVEIGQTRKGIDRVWKISSLDTCSISGGEEVTMGTTDETIQRGSF